MALIFASWLTELVALAATLIAGVYIFYHNAFQYWRKRGIPYPEPSFPFGNTGDVAKRRANLGQCFKSIHLQFPGQKFVGTFQFYKPALLIRDPEEIKRILVKDFDHFHDRGIYADEKLDPLAMHLFLLPGTRWKNLRAKLTPTFTSGKMKMMFPTIAGCGEELVKYLQTAATTGEAVEMKAVFAKFTTDIIATCAFGIESNSLKNKDSEFIIYSRKAFHLTIIRNIRFILGAFVPKLAQLSRLPLFPLDVTEFFLGVVRETIEYREKNAVTRPDFMQLLIQLKNNRSVLDVDGDVGEDVKKEDGGVGLTIDEAAAQAFVFFVAGYETSSTLMSFLIYELGFNQDIQDRLREEVDRVKTEHGGKIIYEAIQEMEYLDRVVAEALRKYPPGPIILRQCTKRYKLSSHVTIEPGTTALVSIWGLHYDPEIYPDPDKFDPDRFLPEIKNKRHHFSYLPFGEGPRICIGSRFALMQSKVGIASIISNYRFKICEKTTSIPLVQDPKVFFTGAVGGINILVSPR